MAKELYIVGVDGSEFGERAAAYATELAHKTGANVLLSYIIHWSGYTPLSVEEAMRRPLDKAEEERVAKEDVLEPLKEKVAREDVAIDTFFTWGHPAHVIMEKAKKEKATMIITGRRGHSNIADLVLGSVANTIAHASDIPVLLIP